MRVLFWAEVDNGEVRQDSLRSLRLCQKLGAPIDVLVAGADAKVAGEQAARISGVERVLSVSDDGINAFLAEGMSKLLHRLSGNYSHIVSAATTQGKDVMPRLAALLDVMQISEITDVVDADTFVRPIYAGNAIATIKSLDQTKVITVRSSSFEPVEMTDQAVAIEEVEGGDSSSRTTILGEAQGTGDLVDLGSARVVISGGRGVGSQEGFRNLSELAQLLGGALGASRAAVDAGFAPNSWQVGQTGKSVSPDLYVAIGISGAIQHLAGMKDSKFILAINKDEEAPIFRFADAGLVGDLNEIVPDLVRAIAAHQNS